MSCGRSTRTLENHDIHRWITLRWPDPPLVLDGPMDGEAFLAYVEQLPAPSLRPGDRLIARIVTTIVSDLRRL